MRTSCAEGYHEIRDSISQDWIPYLTSYGYVPILIPNSVPNVVSYVKKFDIKALLLTGGNDVSPKLYSKNSNYREKDTVSKKRDETETQLLKFAVKSGIPVVGICRGMQLINVYFGGSLIQDISEHTDSKVNHVAENHPVQITHPGFSSFLGRPNFKVNSFHNQGLTLSHLAKDLEPFALSEEDGILEGLFSKKLKLIGIQWHPERKTPSQDIDSKIIKGMFENTMMEEI